VFVFVYAVLSFGRPGVALGGHSDYINRSTLRRPYHTTMMMIRPPDRTNAPDDDSDDFNDSNDAVGDEPSAELADWLDDEFPLGDGVAEDSSVVMCPYCGEPNEIALDAGSGGQQEYIEDCQVCCQPWQVIVQYLPDGSADVSVTPADGD
jgi:hypothetical protein